MASRFGRPPVRDIMYAERWNCATLAAALTGVTRAHLSNATTGRVPPSRQLREQLPKIFARPLEDLFSADQLAAEYAPRHLSYAARRRAAEAGAS
jgi:hypothetical protein